MEYSSVNPNPQYFPLLGFPNETNKPAGEVVYQAHWWNVRIALWRRHKLLQEEGNYGVNLYHNCYTESSMTHAQDRYSYNQGPILVEDAFEAQLAINFLIQKYLPQELINDINSANEISRSAG